MSLKETLRRIKPLYQAVTASKDCVRDMLAVKNFLHEQKLPRTGPIRVGFLCQYIPAWPKVAPLFDLMKADPRFEPYILCVPSGITNYCLNDPSSLENDTYTYMCEHGYSDAVNTLIGKEQWLDLQTLQLSYIFYPRPYNSLLPPSYTAKKVSAYSKVCILMYGMTTTQDTAAITLNRDFMRHVYFYFAETIFAQRYNRKSNRLGHMLGLQKTLCIGYPVLEQLAHEKMNTSPSWDFSKNSFRILWTPRWSTAKELGGSNFFTYRDFFLSYAKEHPDVDILIRPHPLMFSNFLQTGEMTQEQIDDYLAQIDALDNVRLDVQQQYEATLWGSSVLVSDLSGIMPEYFTTGKPMVFCASNMELQLADYFQQMTEKGCYVVNEEQELLACLEALRAGQDRLQQIRQALIPELFGVAGNHATANILEQIAEDAQI